MTETQFFPGESGDQLMERLIGVERALFSLKVQAKEGEDWVDAAEAARLESIRQDIHTGFGRL